MEFLKEIYEERKRVFDNYIFYVRKIKENAKKVIGKDVKVFVFGSVLEDRFSIGLSDIDVAIVTKNEVEDKARLIEKILKGIDARNVFEIHLISEEKFNNWYKRFIKKLMEI